MALFTEEEKTLRRIEKRFAKGVVEYGLIEEGDKILIGLSGGKDSLALVELLARRSRILKPRFSVVAAHVVMRNIPYQSDTDYLRSYAESQGVPFVLYETEFDASTDTRKSPCFLCSWNRRKALFTVAKEQGCNKIALGHHMDDILETLLMNITYQGGVRFDATAAGNEEVRHDDYSPDVSCARIRFGGIGGDKKLSEAGEELSLRVAVEPERDERYPASSGRDESRSPVQFVGEHEQCAGRVAAPEE